MEYRYKDIHKNKKGSVISYFECVQRKKIKDKIEEKCKGIIHLDILTKSVNIYNYLIFTDLRIGFIQKTTFRYTS